MRRRASSSRSRCLPGIVFVLDIFCRSPISSFILFFFFRFSLQLRSHCRLVVVGEDRTSLPLCHPIDLDSAIRRWWRACACRIMTRPFTSEFFILLVRTNRTLRCRGTIPKLVLRNIIEKQNYIWCHKRENEISINPFSKNISPQITRIVIQYYDIKSNLLFVVVDSDNLHSCYFLFLQTAFVFNGISSW